MFPTGYVNAIWGGEADKKRSVLKLLQIVYTCEKQEVHWQHEHKAGSHLHLPDTKNLCYNLDAQ